MRAVLVGLGAVGARAARQLLASPQVDHLAVLARKPVRSRGRSRELSGSFEVAELSPATLPAALRGASVTVLAAPGSQWVAQLSIDAGVPVVSASDRPDEVRALVAMDRQAQGRGLAVVAGAAMAPGLSCLLAAWASSRLDQLSELHIATLGTGGPQCAKRRHASLREPVEEWRDGRWARKAPGSGRELVWFPGQVGGADCYRLNRPDTFLLVRAFPGTSCVTTRAAASRRDRLTSWLPMLRPPHPEGTVGALRVEARGYRRGAAQSVVLGAAGRPALLAGTVAATAALRAATGQLRPGAGGLASLVPDPAAVLAELHDRGVQLSAFEGAPVNPAW